MDLLQPSDEDIREVNTFMNRTDPIKDSFMTNKKKDEPDFRLEMRVHGPLIQGILNRLYPTEVQGGGGRNVKIENKIKEKFGADIFTEGYSQQYSTLRFDANDRRMFTLNEKNLVIDTGSATTFGDDCNTVIGPFSIIDPGPRSLEGEINLLEKEMTFNYRDGPLALLGMQGYITSIEYKYKPGTHPYHFTINFATGNSETFDYTVGRKTEKLIVSNSTNYKRNMDVKKVFDKYPDMNGLNRERFMASGIPYLIGFVEQLSFQIWWKLMGDTSFPLWIQNYIGRGEKGLTYQNTLVASIDWGVIYRSLINGMACAHKSATNVTYYPIINGVLDRRILQRVAPQGNVNAKRKREAVLSNIAKKRGDFKTLMKNNQNVLKMIEDCKNIAEKNPLFLLSSITEPDWLRLKMFADARTAVIKAFTMAVCDIMILYIKPLIREIEEYIKPFVENDGENKEFYDRLYNCMLECPFIVLNRNEFTIRPGRFSFVYKDSFLGRGDEVFILDSIYKLYVIRDTPDDMESLFNNTFTPTLLAAIGALQQQVNPVPAVEENIEEPRGKRRRLEGGGLSQESMVEYTKLLKNNRHIPNFLLWFVQHYIPEFFYIALAYDLALNPSSKIIEKYKDVFEHSLLEKALAPFGRIVDYEILVYDDVENIHVKEKNRDSLILHAAGILKGVRNPEKNLLFRLSKEKAPELLWFIETVGPAAIKVPEEKMATVHSTAIWYYQTLYREDVRLCLQNKRTIKSPVDALHIIETDSTSVKHSTPVSRKSRKKSGKKSGSRSGSRSGSTSRKKLRSTTSTKGFTRKNAYLRNPDAQKGRRIAVP